jgi:predicted nucleic acid-binding protein
VITAVDSSVLLDVLLDDPRFRDSSLSALRKARRAGSLVVCPVVRAEVRASLRDPDGIGSLLESAGILFDPFDAACADLAGDLWRRYRQKGGRREHLVPDFLIGAHAAVRATRLLARDRGFFRRYFEGLDVVEPEAADRR